MEPGHTGNGISPRAVAELSAALDLEALHLYRLAVGRQTHQVVAELSPEAMKRKVDSDRLQRLMEGGAVVEAASGMIVYWGGLNIAGLLLMPPNRHNFVHLNEAVRIIKKCLLRDDKHFGLIIKLYSKTNCFK